MTKSLLNTFICTGLCRDGGKVVRRLISWEGKADVQMKLISSSDLILFSHNKSVRCCHFKSKIYALLTNQHHGKLFLRLHPSGYIYQSCAFQADLE